MLRGVCAGVPEDLGAFLHALLKLDWEGQERCVREVEGNKSQVGKCDVHGTQRLSVVPALARSYFAKQAADQTARA